jgi:hypothetical protein
MSSETFFISATAQTLFAIWQEHRKYLTSANNFTLRTTSNNLEKLRYQAESAAGYLKDA